MAFKLPALPYAFDALEPHVDARTMEIHHGKHHAGYTAKLNAAIEGTDLEGKTIEEILATGAAMSTGVRNTIVNCASPSSNSPPFTVAELEFGSGNEIPLGQALELKGYRPTFHATMVFKRDFL